MRLPIYRHLHQRLEILGFTPVEIGGLCLFFLILAEGLSSIRFGGLFTLLLVFLAASFLRYLHRRFENRYIEKFIRFVRLPDGLHRRILQTKRKDSHLHNL